MSWDSGEVDKNIIKSAPETVKTVVSGKTYSTAGTDIWKNMKETARLFTHDIWRRPAKTNSAPGTNGPGGMGN